IIGNPSLNHRYRKGFYSLFKTLQQNPSNDIKLLYLGSILIVVVAFSSIFDISNRNKFTIDSSTVTLYTAYPK
ncbi:hypothetical protein, partial [Enterococcus casseliflavus]|uniref:hypothetical protein n=1 Tax=Enterococcus casseliflavus TaxID=37734 RepID=UPI0028910414